MFIVGLGTATPPNRYTQAECWQVLQSSELFTRFNPRTRALLRKIFSGNNGIESRALALDPLTEAFELNPDALHARFAKHAPASAHRLDVGGRGLQRFDDVSQRHDEHLAADRHR